MAHPVQAFQTADADQDDWRVSKDTKQCFDFWLCFWVGILGGPVMCIGWIWLAQFMPPPSPRLSAIDLAEVYRNRAPLISIGMMLMFGIFPGNMAIMLTTMITTLMRRMQGVGPAFRHSFLATGIIFLVPGATVPSVVWAVIALHPERAPEITQLISDYSWLSLLTVIGPLSLQAFILAAAIFMDKGPTPVFPRWIGYANAFLGVAAIPGIMAYFSSDWIMSYDGLIVFWIFFVYFSVYYMIMFYGCYRGIKAYQHQSSVDSSADIRPFAPNVAGACS